MNRQSLTRLKSLVDDAQRIVALTGAGISTSAGIPDFRSPGTGLWNMMDDMEAFTSSGFVRRPEKLYQLVQKLAPSMERIQPTKAHLWLADLERKGRLLGTVTQNVDGLHQMAGCLQVVELHGTFRTATCLQCREERDMQGLMEQMHGFLDEVPTCELCGGLFKPNVILFGDLLPPESYRTACQWARGCDLFLVLGSSLLVSPANGLPLMAMGSDADLCIVNLEPTPLDRSASVVLHERIDDVVEALKKIKP